jgi:hypothetical protein
MRAQLQRRGDIVIGRAHYRPWRPLDPRHVAEPELPVYFVDPPVTATSTGTEGDRAWQSGYEYYAVATDTWWRWPAEWSWAGGTGPGTDVDEASRFVLAPTASSDAGTVGERAYDGIYLYAYVPALLWARTAVEDTWTPIVGEPAPADTGTIGAIVAGAEYLYLHTPAGTWVRWAPERTWA